MSTPNPKFQIPSSVSLAALYSNAVRDNDGFTDEPDPDEPFYDDGFAN